MKLVVKQHRPLRRAALILGFVGGAALAVAVAFHYGHWNYIVQSLDSSGSKRGLIEDNIELRRELEIAERELARMRRTAAVDEKARSEYQGSVGKLRNEISDLKLELAFYRDILSSTEPDSGPRVRGFKLRDFGGGRRYQYRLVLTHVNKDDKVAAGRIAVEIRGDGTCRQESVAAGRNCGERRRSFGFRIQAFSTD